MSELDKPRFALRLTLSRIGGEIEVDLPSLIDDKQLSQAWNMMNAFVMDMLDDLGEEVTDERFRELFVELCYMLIYREMSTLHYLPIWEQGWKERLGTRKRGGRKSKGDI